MRMVLWRRRSWSARAPADSRRGARLLCGSAALQSHSAVASSARRRPPPPPLSLDRRGPRVRRGCWARRRVAAKRAPGPGRRYSAPRGCVQGRPGSGWPRFLCEPRAQGGSRAGGLCLKRRRPTAAAACGCSQGARSCMAVVRALRRRRSLVCGPASACWFRRGWEESVRPRKSSS